MTVVTLLRPNVNYWLLGTLGYQAAFRLQGLLANQHLKKMTDPSAVAGTNTVLIVEHPPGKQRLANDFSSFYLQFINSVYTIGIRTSGYPESEEHRLKALGAEFHRTNRGGLITFHGPGQLVAYPVLNLTEFNSRSMKWYICRLEETVIRLCLNSFGIQAERSADTGVWVGTDKICAMGKSNCKSTMGKKYILSIVYVFLGVHGSRYITTHGLALNCDVDLGWFGHIVPCGIPDKGVTSLTTVLKRPVPVLDVIQPFLKEFSKQFACESISPLSDFVKQPLVAQLRREGLINANQEQQLLSSSDDSRILN